MKHFPFLFIVFIISSAFVKDSPNYKATYKITYISNLTNNSVRTESGLLIIKANQESVYATKNFFKRDSILKLINAGTISPNDVMNDNYPKTNFKQYIQKQYDNENIVTTTNIGIYNYVYTQQKTLVWQLLPDTLTIKSYKCLKAFTNFEGRDYVAWYSTDIPISDGPHKFWGLPGLIIKIADNENHYTFELENFEKFIDDYPKFHKSEQIFEVSYDKFKELRKEETEDPLKALESQGIKTVSVNGQAPVSIKTKIKRNPIERY